MGPVQGGRSAARFVVRTLAFAAIYAVTAKLALLLGAVEGFATLVWPPSGLAFAAVVTRGYGMVPAILLGAFVANVWQGAPALAALGVALGNTGEAVLGAYLLARTGFRFSLARIVDVALLVGIAALATLLAATFGPLSLLACGVIHAHRFEATWGAWWMGDFYGVLVVGSFLLAWSAPRLKGVPARHGEALVLGLLLILTSALVFVGPVAASATAFAVLPSVVWGTVRFGQRGATAGAVFVSLAAVSGTLFGYGPFLYGTLAERLWVLQSYVAVLALTLLVLGAAIEERGKAVSELQRALDAREEFLSIASHELRAPVSTMLLNLAMLKELLRDRTAVRDQARVERKVDQAVKQTNRLTALIEQLLDLTRVASGKLELDVKRVDLCRMVQEVCERFSEYADRSGAKLVFSANGPVEGEWDPVRLEQVAGNLVSNAVRHGGRGAIEVEVHAHAGRAALVVRDHGPGIAPDVLPRIFERFERAAGSRGAGGLGLGLYIARQIVEAHGGSIRVASTLGEGAAFIVELPVRRADERDSRESKTRRRSSPAVFRDPSDSVSGG